MTKRFQIVIDRELCEGNGVCCLAAPDVFDLGMDDVLQLKVAQPSAAQLSRVEDAIRRCPKGALTLGESTDSPD
jgi:ferredoxin